MVHRLLELLRLVERVPGQRLEACRWERRDVRARVMPAIESRAVRRERRVRQSFPRPRAAEATGSATSASGGRTGAYGPIVVAAPQSFA